MKKRAFCALEIYSKYTGIKTIVTIIGLIIYASSLSLAQSDRLQLLNDKLSAAKHDTDRVNTYYALSRYYWNKNSDSSLFMAQKSLDLAKKIHFEKGVALAYLTKGVSLVSKGRLPEALECHFQCLRISEKLGLTGLSGNEYNNIGIVYSDMEEYDNALFYYKKAYDIALKQNDPTKYATFSLLVNMGEIFKYKGKPDSTIAYNKKALPIAQGVKDTLGTTITLYNIGENYIALKNYELAKEYLNKALALAIKIKDDEDIAYCHNAFALIYYYTGNYQLSLHFANMALKENNKLGIEEISTQIYNTLYLNHQKLGNYKEALVFRNLGIALKDSLSGIEKTRAITRVQSSYELEKKQQQIDLLNKTARIKQGELKNLELKRNLIAGGALLLLMIAVLLFKNHHEKKKFIKQLEEQNKDIIDKNEHLEELILVRNRFFSIISHDLRGPVNSVKGMIDYMIDDKMVEEEVAFYVGQISQSLHATSKLLDNLLYWAKSQMDGMQVNTQLFDIQEIIQQNVLLIETRATEKKIKIVAERRQAPQLVFADSIMIDIVIRNIVENAVKFLKASNSVIIDTVEKEQVIVVSIKDDGQGIPLEAQSKIFNKYTSYSSFGTAKEKGSGLGLLLCKELIEKNNGTIWFESVPDQGTTFYFTLPLSKK